MFQSSLIKPKNEETLSSTSGATGDILVGRIVPITKQEGLTRSQITTSDSMDFPIFPTFPNSAQEERDPSPPPAELTIGDNGGRSFSATPEIDSSNPAAQLTPQEGEAELDNSESASSLTSTSATRSIDQLPASGSSLSPQSMNDDALPLIGQPMGLPTRRQNFHDIMPTPEGFPGLRHFRNQELLQNTITRDEVKQHQLPQKPSTLQSQLSALLSSTATTATTNNEPTQTSAFNVVEDGNNMKSIMQSQDNNDDLTKALLYAEPKFGPTGDIFANNKIPQQQQNDFVTNTPASISSFLMSQAANNPERTPESEATGSTRSNESRPVEASPSSSTKTDTDAEKSEAQKSASVAVSDSSKTSELSNTTSVSSTTQQSLTSDEKNDGRNETSSETAAKLEPTSINNTIVLPEHNLTNLTESRLIPDMSNSSSTLVNQDNTSVVATDKDAKLTETSLTHETSDSSKNDTDKHEARLINATISKTNLSLPTTTAIDDGEHLTSKANNNISLPVKNNETFIVDETSALINEGAKFITPKVNLTSNNVSLVETQAQAFSSSNSSVGDMTQASQNNITSLTPQQQQHRKENLTQEILQLKEVLDLAAEKIKTKNNLAAITGETKNATLKMEGPETEKLNALNRTTLMNTKIVDNPPPSAQIEKKNSSMVASPTPKQHAEESPTVAIKNFLEGTTIKPSEDVIARAILSSVNEEISSPIHEHRANRSLDLSDEDQVPQTGKNTDLVVLNGDKMFKIKDESKPDEKSPGKSDSELHVNVYFNGKGKKDSQRYLTMNPKRITLQLNNSLDANTDNFVSDEVVASKKGTIKEDAFVPRKVSLLMSDEEKQQKRSKTNILPSARLRKNGTSARSGILKYIKMGKDGSVNVNNIKQNLTATIRSRMSAEDIRLLSELQRRHHAAVTPQRIKAVRLAETKHLVATLKKHQYADALLKKKIGLLHMLNELSNEKIENVMAKFNEYKEKLNDVTPIDSSTKSQQQNATARNTTTTTSSVFDHDSRNETAKDSLSKEQNKVTSSYSHIDENLLNITESYEKAKKALLDSKNNTSTNENQTTSNVAEKAKNTNTSTLVQDSDKIDNKNDTVDASSKNQTASAPASEDTNKTKSSDKNSTTSNSLTASDNSTIADKKEGTNSTTENNDGKNNKETEHKDNNNIEKIINSNKTETEKNLEAMKESIQNTTSTSESTTLKQLKHNNDNETTAPEDKTISSSNITGSKTLDNEGVSISSKPKNQTEKRIEKEKKLLKELKEVISKYNNDSSLHLPNFINNSTATNNDTSDESDDNDGKEETKGSTGKKSNATTETLKDTSSSLSKTNSTKNSISPSSTVNAAGRSTPDPYSELGDSSANGVVSDGNGNYQEDHNPAATPLNGMLTSNAKIKRNKLVLNKHHHHPSQRSVIADRKRTLAKTKPKKMKVKRNKIKQKKMRISKRKISERKLR